MEATKARSREFGERYYETLLNSLTLDQLKTALFRLKRGEAPAVRTRTEAIEAIESAGWVERELNDILLDIEAKSPTRHSAISKFGGTIPAYSDAEMFLDLPMGPTGIQFRPVYRASGSGFSSITFEHSIDVREWRNESETVRKLVTTKIRHPVIVRFYEKLGIAAFFFPGFSHGSAQRPADRLAYETVIHELTVALSYKFNSTFVQFPIAQAVKYLQMGESPEIKIIRTDIDAVNGKVSLDSPVATNSVNDLLLSFLEPHVRKEVVSDLQAAIKTALNDAHADHFVIYWCKERVVTRVRLWSFACELMYIWNDTDSSFRSIDSIIQLLVSVARHSGNAPQRDLWDIIVGLPKEVIVSQGELISKSSASGEEVLSVALRAVQAGILQYAFRLKTTDLLVDCANSWRVDPAFYRRQFKTVTGELIDGNEPSLIEVGFMRSNTSTSVQA